MYFYLSYYSLTRHNPNSLKCTAFNVSKYVLLYAINQSLNTMPVFTVIVNKVSNKT